MIKMELRECYEYMEGDYQEVYLRLGNDQIIAKYLKKYIDRNEMENLKKAITEKRYKDVFLYSHNMKGLGLNLSLTAFHMAASDICEAVRDGEPKEDLECLYEKLANAYHKMETAISQL